MMTTKDLKPNEHHPFYSTYINKVPKDLDLIEGFKIRGEAVVQFFKSLPKEKLEYRYAEGKWSIKEVFQHIIDAERIFMHRCFRIARHDKTALAGFEENAYLEPSQGHHKTLESLIEEYKVARKSAVVFLKSLREIDLMFIGNANGSPMSARAATFIILGHEIHHIDVINERYL